MCSPPCGPEHTTLPVHYPSVISPQTSIQLLPFAGPYPSVDMTPPTSSYWLDKIPSSSWSVTSYQYIPKYVTHPGNPLGPPVLPWKIRNHTSNDTVSHSRTVESSILCIRDIQPISYITCYSSVQPLLGKWILFWASFTIGVKTEGHKMKLDKHFSQQK